MVLAFLVERFAANAARLAGGDDPRESAGQVARSTRPRRERRQ
jgi:hypothetical protein